MGEECRWQTTGRVQSSLLVIVTHLLSEEDYSGVMREVVRIISARAAERRERRNYERKHRHFCNEPRRPATLTEEQKARLAALAERPDSESTSATYHRSLMPSSTRQCPFARYWNVVVPTGSRSNPKSWPGSGLKRTIRNPASTKSCAGRCLPRFIPQSL